jgi:hypothetical protein
MPQACTLRTLANYRSFEARGVVLRALHGANWNHLAASFALRASAHLPPDGTDRRTPVTLYEIVRALDMGDEIRALRGGLASLIPEPVTTAPVSVAAIRTDAERLIRARGSMTRAECARAAGLSDESSVRNVESPTRGMLLAGRLRAWVAQQEAAGVG